MNRGKNLHTGRAVSNNSNFLVAKINIIRPMCRMHKIAFEGLKTFNVGPFPMARAEN